MKPDYLAQLLASPSRAQRLAGLRMLEAAPRLVKQFAREDAELGLPASGPPLFTASDGVLHERPHITNTAATGFLSAMCGILDVSRERDDEMQEAAE